MELSRALRESARFLGETDSGLERATVLSFRSALSICGRKYGSDSETLRLEVSGPGTAPLSFIDLGPK